MRSDREPGRLHRRRRHLARRKHGQVPQGIPRAVHQRRGRRAEHDRHLRRPRAERLPAIRLHDRDVLDLPAVREGARRPLLPEPAGDRGRDRRRRHLFRPSAGRTTRRRTSPDGGDLRTWRSSRPATRPRHEATPGAPQRNGPIYLRLGKAGEPVSTADADPFEFGKIRTLRDGKDVCILSYGPIMKMAFEVADQLEAPAGRSRSSRATRSSRSTARASPPRFARPQAGDRHRGALPQGGLAAQVKQIAWDIQRVLRLDTFTLQDEFIHNYGSHDDLLAAHGLEPDRILRTIGAEV